MKLNYVLVGKVAIVLRENDVFVGRDDVNTWETSIIVPTKLAQGGL